MTWKSASPALLRHTRSFPSKISPHSHGAPFSVFSRRGADHRLEGPRGPPEAALHASPSRGRPSPGPLLPRVAVRPSVQGRALAAGAAGSVCAGSDAGAGPPGAQAWPALGGADGATTVSGRSDCGASRWQPAAGAHHQLPPRSRACSSTQTSGKESLCFLLPPPFLRPSPPRAPLRLLSCPRGVVTARCAHGHPHVQRACPRPPPHMPPPAPGADASHPGPLQGLCLVDGVPGLHPTQCTRSLCPLPTRLRQCRPLHAAGCRHAHLAYGSCAPNRVSGNLGLRGLSPSVSLLLT